MIYQGKQKIWADYQKEIPDNHWFYVRSCIRQNFFPGAEKMFMEICRGLLKKDFFETEHHTTCGGIAYHCDTIPQETVMTIVARQFALMTEAGYENYVASCITSFGNYIEILETWKEFPELETRIRELLWKACRREFNKPKYVAHASDLIYKYRNEIAARAKYRLVNRHTGEPLRAVEHEDAAHLADPRIEPQHARVLMQHGAVATRAGDHLDARALERQQRLDEIERWRAIGVHEHA